MNLQTMTAGVLVALLLSGPAIALTIVNDDEEPHTVTVTQGDDSEQIEIASGSEAQIDCAEGCTLKLASGDEADFGNDDEVVISGGTFSTTE